MGENIVENIHTYGGTAIFLLFCDHQDTESESNEIDMSIPQDIFTRKNISNSLWDNYINNLQDRRKMLWKSLIFLELYPYSYYFVIIKTLNQNNEKYKLV